MWYPVTVACRNIIEVSERQEWAQEHGMKLLNRTWEVIDKRQYVTFNFRHEKDATMFALKWL
jgi:nuclear transport factor 2 (NTF2) superfamily protein